MGKYVKYVSTSLVNKGLLDLKGNLFIVDQILAFKSRLFLKRVQYPRMQTGCHKIFLTLIKMVENRPNMSILHIYLRPVCDVVIIVTPVFFVIQIPNCSNIKSFLGWAEGCHVSIQRPSI